MTNNYVPISYYRKSDEDKYGQVQSIPKQRIWGDERAAMERDKIEHVFTDTKTAKVPGREGFAEMMEFIEKSEKPIKLYAWKTSRLSRNPIDEGAIKYAIARGKIKFVITRDRSYDEYTSQILLGVDFGEATQFSIDLTKDVKEGLKQKIDKGFRPNLSPNGWLSDKYSEKGERKIFEDKKRFPVLQKEIHKILDSKGAYRVADSLRYLKSVGFKTKTGRSMAKTTLFRFFQNPFICGRFQWHGEWKIGKHKPMITPMQFENLQIYIGGKRSLSRKHTTIYNGLVRCNECGCWVTTEPPKIKRQQNGNVHIYNYMRCTKSKGQCSQKCIRVEKVESQISEVLERIDLDSDQISYCFDILQRDQKDNTKFHAKIQEHLKKRYKENEAKILNLTAKYAMDKIDDDIYVSLLDQCKSVRAEIDKQMVQHESSRDTVLDSFFSDMKFAQEIAKNYRKADVERKREIISQLQSNLWLIEGNLFVDLKSSLVVLSQCNRFKTLIEPHKNHSPSRDSDLCEMEVPSGAPRGTPIELIQSYLKIRRFYESVILVS